MKHKWLNYYYEKIGGTFEESKKALEIARQFSNQKDFPELYSTVGVHPTRCDEFEKYEFGSAENYFEKLVELCKDGMKDGKVSGIKK